MYLYKNANAFKHMKVTPCDETKIMLQGNVNPETCDLWEFFDGTIKPGNFYAEDLRSIRIKLLKQGICPKTRLKNIFDIGKLSINVGKDICKIHSLPMYYEEIKEWTSRLDVKYNAEGLGNISLKVLETLLRPKRNTISKEERDKL